MRAFMPAWLPGRQWMHWMQWVRWVRSLLLTLAAAVPLLWPASAHADKFSDSYLSLSATGASVTGQWDIALRDLDLAVGLDQDGNGEITWDEVRSRHAAIAAYALSHLALAADGQACKVAAGQQLVDQHSDGGYSVLRFTATCAGTIRQLDLDYSLLFDRDPQHKGLLRLQTPQSTVTAVFSPTQHAQRFILSKASAAQQFGEYVRTGIGHIWIGFDHLLFLFSLLLPAVFIWSQRAWQPAERFRTSLIDVLKIVTAFTLAHSVTLTLATLQVVILPSRWVESGIAASVVIAALNNLFPVVQGRRWLVAFGFGLIHGFGFASVLADLGLPREALVLALVGFNVGVEVGQMSIVAVFLPLAFALRRSWFYRRLIFIGGSVAIILVASIWFIERAFNLNLISG
jgi:hypothetical protein